MFRTIFHLDLDAFFVSVERILDPSLRDKPVIVGGNPQGRGVVTACSYETRKFGVHSGMPSKQAYKLCSHAIFIHGSHKEYSIYSDLVRDILVKYPPVIEQASVDEFYMDFTGCEKIYGNFINFASKLQKLIWDEVKLPCSIGIGSNKTIAKIASDFNKPAGITYVAPGLEKEFLENMPVETIPGVGKMFLPQLQSRGFYKIGDIAKMPADYFLAAFGKNGLDLWEKANGKGTEYLTVSREQKSISSEQTFSSDISSIPYVEKTLFELTAKICQKLRDKELTASTLTLKLRYSDFNTITRSKTIDFTNDERKVYEVALKLLKAAYTRRVGIRLVGIGLHNFLPLIRQFSLFDDTESKRAMMLEAVDKIRFKFGYPAIQTGEK